MSQSHGRLLWIAVGVEMVNPGVWRKCRIADWMKDGEDVELVLTGVRIGYIDVCLLYTSPSPRDRQKSRMPSSA